MFICCLFYIGCAGKFEGIKNKKHYTYFYHTEIIDCDVMHVMCVCVYLSGGEVNP